MTTIVSHGDGAPLPTLNLLPVSSRQPAFRQIMTAMFVSIDVMMQRVFVYGTLKKGEPNEHVMTDRGNGCAKFFANAVTSRRFPLLIASKYNVPYLLHRPGVGHRIVGEVYEIDSKMFKYLDAFENCPA